MTRIALLFLVVFPSAGLLAQAPSARLHGETEAAQTRKRLVEAQAKLSAGQTADAVDDLLKVLSESGDDLVQLPDGSHPPARRLIHRALAGLPAESLQTLRDRIDEPARKLYEAGRLARDPRPLRELLDRYFVSQSAEPAILLLGELAFERGEFNSAERYWRMLLPQATDSSLSYPKPSSDPAAIQARVLLAALFGGNTERVQKELTEYRTKYPKASGRLAGVEGIYAETLTKWLTQPPQLPLDNEGWTTLGGNQQRESRSGQPLPRIIPNQPKWKVPIPRDAADPNRPKPAGVPATHPLSFHPVILNGNAYLADAARVFSFDLRTGVSRIAFDVRSLPHPPHLEPDDLARPTPQNADYALTVSGGKIYARLGNPGPPIAAVRGEVRKHQAYLLELEPVGNVNPAIHALTLKSNWAVTPPVRDEVAATWEGAPLVVDGIALAAFTQTENSRRIHSVAAYRLPSTKPLWVAEACDEDANQAEEFPFRHELLTLANGLAIYATHTGLTVAYDITTGKRAWAFRNPPAQRPPVGGSRRDISPAVAHAGRVYIAPADGDRIYALDVETGAKLWESGETQVEYLMGVTRNKLIAAIHGPQKGLRGYSIFDGRDREPTGWQNHDDRNLAHYGRGLLSDDVILWPTAAQLYPMNPDDGSILRMPSAGPHGNLAYADGVLLVATPTELWGYLLTPSAVPPAPPAKAGSPWVKLESVPYQPVKQTATEPKGFDPLQVVSLPPEAEIQETRLSVAAWPLQSISGGAELPGLVAQDKPVEQRYFACDSRTLFAIRPSDGAIRWQTPLRPEVAFTRAILTVDAQLIALSADTVGCFNSTDGHENWRLTIPNYSITTATLAGNRVIVLLGDTAILALDIATGKANWLLDPMLRSRLNPYSLESAPTFAPHLLATPRVVFAHRTDGIRLSIDPETGRTSTTSNQTIAGWGSAPLQIGSSIIFPDGPLQITSRSLISGAVDWIRTFPGETSACGHTPAVRLLNKVLLVAVRRSYGVELNCLSLESGKPLWANPPVFLTEELDLSTLDLDRERLYISQGNRLTAYSLDRGRELWSQKLPGTGWRVCVGRSGVIVYPPAPLLSERLEPVVERLAMRFLEQPGLLWGQFSTLAAVIWNRSLPVVLLDSESGSERKRWDVPVSGSVVAVHFAGDLALVVSAGHIIRLSK